MTYDYSNQLEKASVGQLRPVEESVLQRTEQSIVRLEQELEDKKQLLQLLKNNPEVEQILRLLSKGY